MTEFSGVDNNTTVASPTESLVERARLTPQERGSYVHSIRSGGAVFSPKLEEAVLSKALYAAADDIRSITVIWDEFIEHDWVPLDYMQRQLQEAIALRIEKQLEAAGLPRPE